MASFVCLCFPVLVGPWLFGAWEMWWFWPLMTSIFLGTAIFGLRLLIHSRNPEAHRTHRRRPGRATYCLLSCVPFLGYALVRGLMAEVYMDAERMFLLFLGPFLIGVHVVFGLNKKLLRLLYVLVLIDLALLGIYGIVNHIITKSQWVMWLPGYPQYVNEVRATGSYFCPDHFAGIMELALCMCLGLMLDRNTKWRWKIPAVALAALALTGIVMSKSRGGGLTVLVIGGAALVWGFRQWTPRQRWIFRGAAVLAAAVGLGVFCFLARDYTERFGRWFAWQQARDKPVREMVATVRAGLKRTARGRMFGGAIRAWRSNPVFGIGPGMHQNLWPRFAATADGDRRTGRWPSQPNRGFWSDFVHNDWLQLLEEFGMLGFVLFLPPAFMVFYILLRGLESHYSLALGGILAFVCMSFHSLGDFNLQMPATGWLFATILAIPAARSLALYRRLQ